MELAAKVVPIGFQVGEEVLRALGARPAAVVGLAEAVDPIQEVVEAAADHRQPLVGVEEEVVGPRSKERERGSGC